MPLEFTKLQKEHCCGCGACAQRCPKQCIIMIEDEKGFLYPSLNNNSCINCNLCIKVCPYSINHPNTQKQRNLSIYASQNQNNHERKKSSSGGIFIALAKEIIAQKGIVFGAIFDQKWEVHQAMAINLEEVYPMMGSKYTQSRIENSYILAEEMLKQGSKVLFTGTPCQISGLKHFLLKEYTNLYTVSILCHGVPSPLIWRNYLTEISKGEKISYVNMRDKSTGWSTSSMIIKNKKKIIINEIGYRNYYRHGYTAHLYTRPSCYNCNMIDYSGSDLTIGVFWGVSKIIPEWNDDKGTSIVIIHSHKGNMLFQSTSLNSIPITIEDARVGNGGFSHQLKSIDNNFWNKYRINNELLKTLDSYFHEPKVYRIYRDKIWRIKRYLKNIRMKIK